MRLTAIILLSACLMASASGNTQSITISVKNASLEKVFEQIKKQTGYTFLYKDEVIKKAGKVNLNVSNVSVETALQICFKDLPLTYKVFDNKTIVVGEKETTSPNEEANLRNEPPPPIDITGKVTDENGNPLAGASVKVKNSSKGTTTNNEGVFILKSVDDNAVLEITYVGYEVLTVPVNNRTAIVTSLKQKPESLNEVVINKGYYTEKQRLSTGNVSTVKAADIEKQPVNNPLLALQGRVSGMEITQSTGLPGSGVKVQIRGRNSIQQGNDPLYIIDGVPYFSQNLPMSLGGILGGSGSTNGAINGSPLSNVNPFDIESIDILKDADATAIYGSRGANGVVLITTKKGKSGKMKANINMQNGWGKVTRKLDLLGTSQYLEMRREALQNDGLWPFPPAYYQYAPDLFLWDTTTRYTDWQKELIGGTAHYYDVQASISGGNVNTQYLVGGGYHKETTVFPGDMADQKASVHFSINSVSSNQKFRLLLGGNYMLDNNRLMVQDLTSLATTLAPNAPAVYNADGTLNWEPDATGVGSWQNPLTYSLLKFKNNTSSLIGNAVLSYQLLPGLEFKSNFGYTNVQSDQSNIFPSAYADPALIPYLGSNVRSSRFANSTIRSWIIEPQAIYTRHLGNGQLTALIGTSVQQSSSTGIGINASGFNSDLVLEDVKAAPLISVYTTINSTYRYNALFGRINYNWRDKWLINLTTRRDGTSRFGPAKQFHNFAAAGIGWIFSKENFIQTNFPLLSFGKIRASYGTTGNDQVGDYSFLDLYSPISAGVPYQGIIGVQPTRHFTPDLAWEETRKLEGGIELGFLKDRILITASYYRNRSSNQLTNYLLPYVTGFSSINKNLNALVQNNGWEFLLNTTNVNTKNFQWASSFNLTLNRNKLIAVAPGMSDTYQRLAGYPLGTLFLYHFIGVDPATGLYQFSDPKGNPTSSPDTAFLLTTHPINTQPKFYGGFQNSVSYKGFQLDFLFQFIKQAGRNYLYNSLPGEPRNQPISVLNRWRQPGDISNIQRFSWIDPSVTNGYYNAQYSDQVYSDASFIRLKNLSVSWAFPERLSSKAHLQNCRLYIQGHNLLTITNFKGMDPENQSGSSLPPLKVWTIGIQITL